MKRTLSVLASLAAIALLSCSSLENSPASAEDVNLPQSLTKASASLESLRESYLKPVEGTDFDSVTPSRPTGSMNRSCSGSMSVSSVSYGSYAWSSRAICDFTSLPAWSTNLYYELYFGSYSNVVGNFGITNLKMECGYYEGTFNWYGDLTPVGTGAFGPSSIAPMGTPANVRCYLSFYGRCNGTAVGGGPCSFSINNISMVSHYNY